MSRPPAPPGPHESAGALRALLRWAPLRMIASRPLYFSSLVLTLVLYGVLSVLLGTGATRMLLAWDGGMAVFLASVWWVMRRAGPGHVETTARRQDVGQGVVLLITVVAAALSFLTIAVEIGFVRKAQGLEQAARIALILATILLSWSFVQSVFALHYAHHYFVRGEGAGLEFPGPGKAPEYADFVYFAFTIGAAFATSDVNVTTPAMRRVVVAHTIISFFFNTFILGLSVNVGASLL